MSKYELTLVLHPSLEEEQIKEEFEGISEILNRFGATIEKVDDWGKRKLAYEIAKVNEGFYRFVTFSSPLEAPAEIESRLRIRENLLRFLIVKEGA